MFGVNNIASDVNGYITNFVILNVLTNLLSIVEVSRYNNPVHTHTHAPLDKANEPHLHPLQLWSSYLLAEVMDSGVLNATLISPGKIRLIYPLTALENRNIEVSVILNKCSA